MNREIKFRGFQKSWIYGGISIFHNEAAIFDINCVANSAYEVDIKSVGQFTGLKDVENNEIFEGDIVLGYNNPHVVTFADGAFYLTYNNSSVRLSITCGALQIIGNIFHNSDLLQSS